jgi:hypothetical protein
MMPEDEQRAALVFSESVRALQDQATVVDGLRSRAGMLVSVTALVTSFFSGFAQGHPKHLDLWGWIATALFVAIAGISVWVLWPREKWAFTVYPTVLVRDYLDDTTVTLPRCTETSRSGWEGRSQATR